VTEYIVVPQGDTLTTIFDLNLDNGGRNDPWYLTIGLKGVTAGEKSGSGGVNVSFPNQGALTDVCSPPLPAFPILANENQNVD